MTGYDYDDLMEMFEELRKMGERLMEDFQELAFALPVIEIQSPMEYTPTR